MVWYNTYRMKIDFSALEGFEWDKGNLEHIKKHNVDFRECEDVFFNKPLIVFVDEEHSATEKRYKTFGVTADGRKLALAITIRNNKIRVVMARNRNKKEIMQLGGERKRI